MFVFNFGVQMSLWSGITHKSFLTFNMEMAAYQLQWCTRGYYIYMEQWEAAIRESFNVKGKEKKNMNDPSAVAIVHENAVVGHLPQKMSWV